MPPVVIPHCIAGLANFQSSWILQSISHDVPSLPARILCMVIWIWLNLFTLDLANQRLDDSVQEDAVNKPWRPIPAGRLTQPKARLLLMLAVPMTLIFTYFAGGWQESLVMMTLNWMYNDLGGANESFWLRNLLNALGFMDFIAGASVVIGGIDSRLSTAGYTWVAMMGGCVFTTISLQDLYDQEGDSARDRKTMPLVLGDWPCRVITATGIVLWTGIVAVYLAVEWCVLSGLLMLAIVIAGRCLVFRSAASDRRTFKMWCLWIVVLYALPAMPMGGLA